MLLFLNMSGGEIFMVFLVVLLLFGPQSIPTIAQTLGRAFRQVKDAAGEIQREIRDSADKNDTIRELQKEIESLKQMDVTKDIGTTITQDFSQDLTKDISKEIDDNPLK
jgi:Sec-independent protein translocase protein TatA